MIIVEDIWFVGIVDFVMRFWCCCRSRFYFDICGVIGLSDGGMYWIWWFLQTCLCYSTRAFSFVQVQRVVWDLLVRGLWFFDVVVVKWRPIKEKNAVEAVMITLHLLFFCCVVWMNWNSLFGTTVSGSVRFWFSLVLFLAS